MGSVYPKSMKNFVRLNRIVDQLLQKWDSSPSYTIMGSWLSSHNKRHDYTKNNTPLEVVHITPQQKMDGKKEDKLRFAFLLGGFAR